jgi:hypothetical protein
MFVMKLAMDAYDTSTVVDDKNLVQKILVVALVQVTINNARIYGHFTTGGIEDRIDSTLPPVRRPKIVPRSYSKLNST